MVHLGHVKSTALPVAIKKIKLSAMVDGISMDAIREVKFLQELRHENIIRLIDVFSSKNQNLNLVLEFLDSDLEMIIKDTKIGFGGADIKSWLAMSLRGLWWCHKNFVLHRVGLFHVSSEGRGIELMNRGEGMNRISNQTISSYRQPVS